MARNIAEFLPQVPIFAGLTPDEIHALLPAIIEQDVPRETVVYEQGSVANAAYVITLGQLEVDLTKPDGTTTRVRTLGPGHLVGELALLDSGPRSATVRARNPAHVYRIDGTAFNELRAQRSPAAYKVIRELVRVMCDRFRDVDAQIERTVDFGDPPSVEIEEAGGVGNWLRRALRFGGQR